MLQRYFDLAFAEAGDLMAIPDAEPSNGAVSYSIGFSFNYQRNLQTDSAALPTNRIQFNQLFNDITVNLQNYQQNGTPEFITTANNNGSPYPYLVGAMVRYSTSGTAPFQTFICITNTTSLPGTDATWSLVADKTWALSEFVQLTATSQTITGAITITGASTLQGGLTVGPNGIVTSGSAVIDGNLNVGEAIFTTLLQFPINDGIDWAGTAAQIIVTSSDLMVLSANDTVNNVVIDSAANLTANGELIGGGGVTSDISLSMAAGTFSCFGTIDCSGEVGSQGGYTTATGLAVGIALTANPAGSDEAGLIIQPNGALNSFGSGWFLGTTAGEAYISFFQGGGPIGSISNNNGSVGFNGTSDERAKMNETPVSNVLDLIDAAPVIEFEYKIAPGVKQIGWHAHVLQASMPSAVIGTRGATKTQTNVVLGVNGNVLREGVTQAQFEAEMAKPASETLTNVVIHPNGRVFKTGITQAEFEAGQSPLSRTAKNVVLNSAGVVIKTRVTQKAFIAAQQLATPTYPAGSTWAASGTVTTGKPRYGVGYTWAATHVVALPGPSYPAGSTWAASATTDVLMQVNPAATAPMAWAGVTELRKLLKAQSDDIAELRALVATLLPKPAAS